MVFIHTMPLASISEEGDFMVEGIASASMALSQAKFSQQVSTSVLKMGMNQSKTQAQGLLKMMESSRVAMERSVTPHLGGRFDARA